MKILLIGGNGTIGKKVRERLLAKHEVIVAGKKSGDIQFELENSSSIKAMFEKTGKLDAIIAIAGNAKWESFDKLTEEDYYIGIRSKLMGQVNLVRIGKDYLNRGGSITLTTGVLADDPVDKTTSGAMVNGAIHSFVKAVDLELDGIRVNVVCADVVEESYEKYKDLFPGHSPVSMNKVIDGYIKSVEGRIRGQVIRIKA